MAKMNPLTGELRGLVGTVVLSSWRGVDYIKHKGRKSKKPKTQPQLEHQAKFGLVSKFVTDVSKVLDHTYKMYAIRQTGSNAAFKSIFKNSATGTFPDLAIDYSKAHLSKGDLAPVKDLSMQLNDGDQFHYNWTDNTGEGIAKADDQCFCVIYFPAIRRGTIVSHSVNRNDCSLVYQLTEKRDGPVETWFVTISKNEKEAANSIYTGQISYSVKKIAEITLPV